MNADDLLIRLVLNYGNPSGTNAIRAALLVDVSGAAKNWRVRYKAIDPGPPPPAAKILTTLAKELGATEFLSNYCLVLNYTATDWCLGLAWLLKVKYVLYLDKGVKAVRTSTDDAGADGFPAWTLSTWNWDCTYDQANRRYKYGVDSKSHPSTRDREDKTTIQAIIASVANARAIDKVSFAGVTFSAPPPLREGFIPMPGNAFRDDLFTRAAFSLVNRTWKHDGGRGEGLSGHNIGAIAVGQDDKILGWAVNVSAVSRCFHAESLLVIKLLSSGINLKSIKLRIYCTLEPCQMCSGLITTMCPGALVIYGMADPKIKNNSLTRKRNDCIQQLSKTCVNFNETIPSLLGKLRARSGLTDNITGFLDAPKASRAAFGGAQTALQQTPRGINRFHNRVDHTLGGLDAAAGRRAIALLDVRHASPQSGMSQKMQALDLAMPPALPPKPDLLWVGTNWKIHLPFVQYLDDFLESIAVNKV